MIYHYKQFMKDVILIFLEHYGNKFKKETIGLHVINRRKMILSKKLTPFVEFYQNYCKNIHI